ncbi:hypothetical protein [Planococcus alpniumensis]|uniref:hypothetical protein n=1 Tax=Planococcus alpniumensis TaxID=2708345 RepID=UPI001B8D4800|nr:hypothetical protein [Planococcus sp. MSAK28401]
MLSNIFLVIAMLALGSMLLAAISGLLKDGLKGLKKMRNGQGFPLCFILSPTSFF